jgi:hypothetical protein
MSCRSEAPTDQEELEPEPELPTAAPADFALTFRSGPVNLTGGGSDTYILISPAEATARNEGFRLELAHAPLLEGGRGEFGPRVVDDWKMVPNSAVLPVYHSVLRSDFFGLEETYRDATILDGGVRSLEISADARSHAVTVVNAQVPPFDDVVKQLELLVSSELDQ